MTSIHTLEKYTFHTLFEMVAKGLCVRSECNILTSSSFVFSSISFSFCWAAQSRVLRAHSPLLGASSLYSILPPTNWLQLTEPVCRTGLYNCLTPTCFLWASHLHPIQPVYSQGYTLISSTGCTCSLIDGWVEGQYVTLGLCIHLVTENLFLCYCVYLYLLMGYSILRKSPEIELHHQMYFSVMCRKLFVVEGVLPLCNCIFCFADKVNVLSYSMLRYAGLAKEIVEEEDSIWC